MKIIYSFREALMQNKYVSNYFVNNVTPFYNFRKLKIHSQTIVIKNKPNPSRAISALIRSLLLNDVIPGLRHMILMLLFRTVCLKNKPILIFCCNQKEQINQFYFLNKAIKWHRVTSLNYWKVRIDPLHFCRSLYRSNHSPFTPGRD